MDCTLAREALSARIDGEREPVPAARVDEHLDGCSACGEWYRAGIAQTQVLRRLAGRSQVAAVSSARERHPVRSGSLDKLRAVSWQRWALAGVGFVQLILVLVQALGDHHDEMAHSEPLVGHLTEQAMAGFAGMGVMMLAIAVRPVAAGGLNWAFAAFAGILAVYEITDLVNGEISVHHALTHLPVLAGAVLTWMVWHRHRPGGPDPSLTSSAGTGDTIVLPDKAALGRRRYHLYPTDGSAA
ncbi:MAG: zf-HC2 domain-containing protein [Mycobacterium sp.]|nr:zf-HC2 domain-containing protein [Mycobacterium sp.]